MEVRRFDAEYLRRLCAGDDEIERHFAAYFSRLIFLKISRRVAGRDTVQEVQQETFARVFSIIRKGAVQCPEALPALVASTAENVYRELVRGWMRSGSDEPVPDVADQRYDLDRELIDAERKKHVRELLATLSPKDRRLLRMLFFEGLDRTEVCRKLGVTPDYLRVVTHRARARLRAGMLKKIALQGETDFTVESPPL